MADVGALHPEDHIFGDVGGMVGYALQVAGNQQGVQCLSHDFGSLVHGLHELDEGVVAHSVDHAVHLQNCLGEFDLALDKRFQRAPHHGAHRCAHARNVYGEVGGGKLHHIHHAFGDVYGLVADAFKVRIDFGDGENEAQVNSHGLLHGE